MEMVMIITGYSVMIMLSTPVCLAVWVKKLRKQPDHELVNYILAGIKFIGWMTQERFMSTTKTCFLN